MKHRKKKHFQKMHRNSVTCGKISSSITCIYVFLEEHSHGGCKNFWTSNCQKCYEVDEKYKHTDIRMKQKL